MGKVIIPKATALYDSKPERKGHARLRAHHRSFIIILVLSTLHNEPPRFSSSRDERGNLTCSDSQSRSDGTNDTSGRKYSIIKTKKDDH